ncbi:putative secreted protein [Propionispora sp. 2/2-37]|uniref:hypothetical protein n=1 Tax=Propionispora sp. 2/2-37 TaxID=1677858 RepID=UPI0006BB57E8|nr:hypothetical protein [Propionispora sp. 2/2-37]CUH97324.1 putative secreted protein [Propionispora sp. 2/2-37]
MRKSTFKLFLIFVLVLCFSINASAQNAQEISEWVLPEQGEPPSTQPQTETSALYTQIGTTVTKTKQTINAPNKNESGIKVAKSGVLNLSNSIIVTTGITSSEEESNFYGLNAAILAESGSKINLKDSTITTTGEGANAIFATGTGSEINVSDVNIHTSANSSRGLDATLTGTVNATNVNITTEGMHSAAIATDRGNGTINVTGGSMKTSGEGSPGIYSTGDIAVTNAQLIATGSEAAVVEGKNSITLKNTTLSGKKNWGVMMYQSFSGDAEVGTSHFTMDGGSLSAETGPLFYITNTEANISLKNVKLTSTTGTLLSVGAGKWGTPGANGAMATFTANDQTLDGNIISDKISMVKLNLQNNSTWNGSINADNTAKSVELKLDKSSKWNVTGTSYLTTLIDDDTTLSNIDDNGFTIYYNASEDSNKWLGHKTFTLKDGGKLMPRN